MTNTIIQYTSDIINKMSNDELSNALVELQNNHRYLEKFLRYHEPHLWDELLKRTGFLQQIDNCCELPIGARVYCILNGISEHPICSNPNCGNIVGWDGKHSRFRMFCSCSCQAQDATMQLRRKETNLKKYGVPHYSQTGGFKDKLSEKWSLKTKTELDQINAKRVETCLTVYGVEHASQSKVIQDRVKQTMLDKYGVEHALQSKEILEKALDTCKERYGTEHPIKLDEFKQKMKSTWVEHHDGIGFGSELTKASIKDKYGVQNVSQLDWVKQKVCNTCEERYGVRNYAQSLEYHKSKQHKFTDTKFPGVSFDSKWEILLYDFLTNNHLDFTYQPDVSIPYEYDGISHTYHPDFLVNDRLFEVKGNHFFRINESTGVEEMFCPYRNPEWSDEEYANICGLYEAKHQCMLNNSVIILRENQVNSLSISLFQ